MTDDDRKRLQSLKLDDSLVLHMLGGYLCGTCPPGFDCTIRCDAASCGDIQCALAKSCDIACSTLVFVDCPRKNGFFETLSSPNH